MKVIYVITGLTIGGAEKQVCLLADKMVEKNNDVILISLKGDAQTLPADSRVKVYQLNMNKNPLSFLVVYRRLFKIVKDFGPDVIHSHLYHANIMCRLLRIILPIKRLVTSSHSRYEGGWFRMASYRLTYKLSDVITNVSRDAVEESIRRNAAPAKNIESVANGIDLNKFKYISTSRGKVIQEFSFSEDNILLLAVGRLTQAKDYNNLLHAFQLIYKENHNLRLLIVGDGELRTQLNDLKVELGLCSAVIFTGIRDDIPILMNAVDIYVMSSAWEGLPLVIGEAMACNCLVVSTDCGGVAEIVGKCGLIVPTRSSEALAAGIKQAIVLPNETKKQLKSSARFRVNEHFSIDAVVNKWLHIYSAQS